MGFWPACGWQPALRSSAGHPIPTASRLPASLSPADDPAPTSSATPGDTRITQPVLASATPSDPLRICSPFTGATFADLVASISNPFNPPPPGSDDPHQAVDLAVQRNGIALAGDPALAVLSGTVAMVTEDRFPYGYALLVETSLETLPPVVVATLQPPSPAPTYPPNPALTCPPVTPEPAWDGASRSLYVLYAHLQERPAFQPGDRIQCGQAIGRIGQSGNALNPHLHLEVRVGPAGARFSSMAHYDNTARPEEMGSYCLWRVSNIFQLVDPQRLLVQIP